MSKTLRLHNQFKIKLLISGFEYFQYCNCFVVIVLYYLDVLCRLTCFKKLQGKNPYALQDFKAVWRKDFFIKLIRILMCCYRSENVYFFTA
jgi:hypothetical protein